MITYHTLFVKIVRKEFSQRPFMDLEILNTVMNLSESLEGGAHPWQGGQGNSEKREVKATVKRGRLKQQR